ncbi:MAG: hypothetical protein WB579_03795 [Bryobacteraceae bacterium]
MKEVGPQLLSLACLTLDHPLILGRGRLSILSMISEGKLKHAPPHKKIRFPE